MCGSVLSEDLGMFLKYLKSDLLSLTLVKVITVRMTLARLLINQPSIATDSEIQAALSKLRKDSCVDIRDLITSNYDELMSKAKLL